MPKKSVNIKVSPFSNRWRSCLLNRVVRMVWLYILACSLVQVIIMTSLDDFLHMVRHLLNHLLSIFFLPGLSL